MNDLFHVDLEAHWRKSLCFLFFIVVILNSHAQIENSYFTYDTTWIVPIETSNVLVNFSLPLEVTVDDERGAAYIFLDIQHDKRTIHILEVSTITGISKIHDIKYDRKTKVDSRTNKGSIAMSPKNEGKQILILLDDVLMSVNIDQHKIIGAEKIDNDYNYLFPFDDYSIVGHYYNRMPAKHKTGIAIMKNGQIMKAIHPHTDFIQFTHFAPNRLIDCSESNIAWLSVSKPMLFLYNHKLVLQDSICFDTSTWVNVDSVKDLPKYHLLGEKGLFEFGTAILEDTASKNLSVQFVSDSLILVTSNYTTSVIRESLFSISDSEHLSIISSRFANIDSLSARQKSRENFEAFLQTASGNISKDRLYYAMSGSGSLPWRKPSMEIDNQKFTYIHMHIFSFKLQ